METADYIISNFWPMDVNLTCVQDTGDVFGLMCCFIIY